MNLYQVNDGSPNHYIHPSKIIQLNSAGLDWRKALLGPNVNPDDYIAPGIALTVEDPESIAFTSSMETDLPLQSLINKLSQSTVGQIASAITKVGDAVAGATGKSISVVPPNVRFQTTLSQLPAWKSSDAAGISDITFKFYFGQGGVFDGRTEVYNPVILLSRVNVPDLVGQNTHILRGPLPSIAFIYGALGASVAQSVADIAKGVAGNATSSQSAEANFESQVNSLLTGMENRMWNAMKGFKGVMTMRVGTRIFLPEFYVKETKYHFGTEVDDYGFPIYGEVTWSGIKTIQLVNSGMPQYQLYGSAGTPPDPKDPTVPSPYPKVEKEPTTMPNAPNNPPDSNTIDPAMKYGY